MLLYWNPKRKYEGYLNNVRTLLTTEVDCRYTEKVGFDSVK